MTNNPELYITKINTNIAQEEFDKLLKMVDKEKAAQILRLKFRDDALRTLIGNLLMRFILCKKTGAKSDMLEFGTNGYGKPILLNYEHIHFNVSHSGNWVLCGLSSESIGVDVEIIKPMELSLTSNLFTDEEKNYLTNDNQTRLVSFYKIWTLKESYIKAIGKGLFMPLNSFCIVKNGELDFRAEDCYFSLGFLDKTSVYAVCTSIKGTVTHISVGIDELIGGLI